MSAILYCVPASPSCNFVRSLAKHIGVDLCVKDLDFSKNEHLADDYVKLNPFHKVPTLDDGGFVLYESAAIAYYLLRKYAPESDLYPKCLKSRSRVDQVLGTVASTIEPRHMSFLRESFCKNAKPTEESMAAFEDDVLKGLQLLVAEGPFCVGDTLTLADLAIVANLAVALIYAPDTTKFPKLLEYYERVRGAVPYFKEIYESALASIQDRWAELK
ncbi:hypothetical protein HPB50_006813 [Hyalomma asiaticum]|uniref:Uncharacterized protein n=1 Tax=Hyalomma asiaticum TaxID=266040 RepID=A0ACB7TFW0_HYAAI|nr:hypothetical protein HPB50_006813 [Hyalomma asiaticum]